MDRKVSIGTNIPKTHLYFLQQRGECMKKLLAAAALLLSMTYGSAVAADAPDAAAGVTPTLIPKLAAAQPAPAAPAAAPAPVVAPAPAPAPAVAAPVAPAQPAAPAVDKKLKDKLDVFYAETKDLRKQIVIKETEMTALMQQPAPDHVVAGKLGGELFDLYSTFQEKAHKAGLDDVIVGPPGMAGGAMSPFPSPKLDKSDD